MLLNEETRERAYCSEKKSLCRRVLAIKERQMKFKFWKSVKNDYTLGAAVTGIVVGIVLFLHFSVVSTSERLIEIDKMIGLGFCPQTYSSFGLAAVLLAVIIGSLICLIRRAKYIKSFVDVKTTVKAKVVSFRPIKNAFKAVVEIPYKGDTLKKKIYVMATADKKSLQAGSEIELLIKDDDPRKTLLAGMFFE